MAFRKLSKVPKTDTGLKPKAAAGFADYEPPLSADAKAQLPISSPQSPLRRLRSGRPAPAAFVPRAHSLDGRLRWGLIALAAGRRHLL